MAKSKKKLIGLYPRARWIIMVTALRQVLLFVVGKNKKMEENEIDVVKRICRKGIKFLRELDRRIIEGDVPKN